MKKRLLALALCSVMALSCVACGGSKTETSAGATGGDLRSRMKAAMTASEFAFATYMYGKIDLGYAQSLYATDKAAAKQYIYSRVSASEISRALEIYAKYAYLVG